MRQAIKSGLQMTGAACLTVVIGVAQSGTPVADAAMRGDTETVRSLLRGGADVNAAHADGMTPLHWASYGDHVEMAKALIYAGANPNVLTRLGDYSPLILASMNGFPELIETLIEAGANVNATTTTGTSPIHFAAAAGNPAAVSALLDHGADANDLEAVWEQTPLMFAASANRTDTMAVLISRGADFELATKMVPIAEFSTETAAEQRLRNALRAALVAGADGGGDRGGRGGQRGGGQRGGQRGGARGQRGGQAAAAQGQRGGGRAQRGGGRGQRGGGRGQRGGQAAAGQADPPAAGQRRRGGRGQRGGQAAGAQAGAAGQRRRGGRGQRGGGRGGQAAGGAQRRGGRGQGGQAQRGGGRGGRRGGQDPTETGAEPQGGQAQAVRQVSGGGRNSNIGGRGGNTALLHAARQGHIEASMLLLDAGADINQVYGGDQSSPLMVATINGHFDLAMELLERGADPNLVNIVGAAPLYGSTNVQWAPTAFYPQPSTKQEKTAYLELMKALLDAGADPNARLTGKVWYTGYNFDQSGENETGATAFWRAAQSGDVDSMRLLVRNGADPELPNTVTRSARGRRGGEEEKPTSTVPAEVVTAAQEALAERRSALGDQHPATLASIYDMGVLLQKAGKLDEAAALHREALDGRRTVLGEDHPATLASIQSTQALTDTIATIGEQAAPEPSAVETSSQEALAQRRSALGDQHPATLASIHDMGVLLQKAGKLDEAAAMFSEALAGRREVLGEDHPATLASKQSAQALTDTIAATVEEQPQDVAQAPTRSISEASAAELRGEDPKPEEADEPEIPDLGPPIPQGGPATSALHMAAGAGYDGNFHVDAPYGRLPAVKFLIEELDFDVNARDYRGYTAMHHAAFRGDNEMILYLVDQGGDPKMVSRSGQTTVDMANGPIQRLQPFEDTIALLEGMGAKNNHRAVSR